MDRGRETAGIVFNIQKFSVNDGPGIRTVVFLKGCPLHCTWCSNPESQSFRIQVLWDSSRCIGCHHCIGACPVQAVNSLDGRIYIDHAKCISCGKCVRECPARALKNEGETKTVQEVLDVCLQDLPFYEESGGGVTLSGGEMLGQPEFSKAMFRALKEEGIHTCCETTGFARPEVFLEVIQDIDTILFDMKHWNPARHAEGTGVTNELPLVNMTAAVALGKDVLPRIPVIPGFNDSFEDAKGMARMLETIGAKRCQLLPFHRFGENKYTMLGIEYAYKDIPNLHREDLEDYRQVFIDNGMDAFF